MTDNAGAHSAILQGNPLDFAYDIERIRGHRHRFRVNATACRIGQTQSVGLTFRSIPSIPPTIDELGVEDGLVECLLPPRGMVLIAGSTGSGKTTLLGSIFRHIRVEQPRRFVVTYEEPVEFDLFNIPGAIGPITQSEIPFDLKKFAEAPKNTTRRATHVILLGESRDTDTLRGLAEASELGPTVYSTIHTRSVSETLRRYVNQFQTEDKSSIAAAVAATIEAIVFQMLVPKSGGGRVAVREWLKISKEFRKSLLTTKTVDWPILMQEELYRSGQPILPYAHTLLEKGVIEEEQYLAIEREHGTMSEVLRGGGNGLA